MDPDPLEVIHHLTSQVVFLFSIDGGLVLGAIFLLFLITCSALISGSEVAFFSLDHNDLNEIKESSSKYSKRIIQLRENPKRLLATILISNNFINIAIIIVSEYLLRRLLPDQLYQSWGVSLASMTGIEYFTPDIIGRTISFLITIVLVTFLLVLFGEVTPKLYANIHNTFFAKVMATPLTLLYKLCRPMSTLLVGWTDRLEHRVGARQSPNTDKHDLDRAIDIAMFQDEDGGDEEADILKSILTFGDVATKQIMKSRVDVIAIDEEMSFSELMKIVRDSGFSRLPVYKDDFDNIRGILYVKDLLGHLNKKDDYNWQELIRENLLYVPESKKIDDLLKEFQKKRMHMAIVVDEYGGSAGIVTLEDVMEEVIGDIKDEFDDDREIDYFKVNDKSYIFEGKTLLNDVCRIMHIDMDTFDEEKGESDSLAGLVLEMTGRMPKINQEFTHNNFIFKIIAASKRRIERINVTIEDEE